MPDIGLVKIKAALGRMKRFLENETVLALALLGAAVSMLWIPPDRAYPEYIDWKVLACLFSLMAVVAGLRKTGLFDRAAASMMRFCGSVRRMSVILVGTTFFVSMAITNDVALITFVPLSLILMKDIKNAKTRMTVISLQTIGANLGSSLTPVGNPQNLYLFSFYAMRPEDFFTAIFPVIVVGGLLLLAALYTVPNEKMRAADSAPNYATDPRLVLLYLSLFVLSVLAVFRVVDHRLATGVVIAAILAVDRKLFLRIDYSLLFTFAGFFVFIGNLQRIEGVSRFLTRMVAHDALLVSALASQVISNVPAAILLSRFTGDAGALLRGVSIGGMGTVIASLASVISFKFFTREYRGSGLDYLRTFTKWNVLFLVPLYVACLIFY